MTYENEEWKPVAGFAYEVSSHGRIRKTTKHKDMPVGYVIRQSIGQKTGYLRVSLFREGKYHHFGVHALVCAAFCGEKPSPDHEVAHWDGVKTNNHFSNLRWVTHVENGADMIRHGRTHRRPGEMNPQHKLTEQEVVAMRMEYRRGRSVGKIARARELSKFTARDAIQGLTWSHITDPPGTRAVARAQVTA
jgi:hypothetical protein